MSEKRYDFLGAQHGDSRYGRSQNPAVIQGSVQDGRPVPAGVHIIKGHERADNVLRDRYENWLGSLWAQGFISDSEHAARVKAVEAAEVMADLQYVLQDLPPLPAPDAEKQARKARKAAKKAEKKTVRGLWKSSTSFRFATYLSGIIWSLNLAITPACVIVSLSHKHPLVWGPLVIVPGILAGAGLLVWVVIMWATDKEWYSKDRRTWSS